MFGLSEANNHQGLSLVLQSGDQILRCEHYNRGYSKVSVLFKDLIVKQEDKYLHLASLQAIFLSLLCIMIYHNSYSRMKCLDYFKVI